MKLIRPWLPSLLWTFLILSASSDLFSAGHSGQFLRPLLQRLLRGHYTEDIFAAVHQLIRKACHVLEYGVASALFYRAQRGDAPRWSLRSAFVSLILALFIATVDEVHQTFVPTRTGSPVDVAIDLTGAFLAQAVIRAGAIRNQRPHVTLRV